MEPVELVTASDSATAPFTSPEPTTQSPVELGRGDVLHLAGAPLDRVYRVVSGALLCRVQDHLQRRIISRVVEVGEWVGLESLVGAPARATVESATRTIVEPVIEDGSPDLRDRLLAAAVKESMQLEARLCGFGVQAARARAASALLDRARPAADGALVVTPEMSRQDLAAYAGMAPETFIRLLSSFRGKNIVQASGRRISITDPRRLASVAGLPAAATTSQT